MSMSTTQVESSQVVSTTDVPSDFTLASATTASTVNVQPSVSNQLGPSTAVSNFGSSVGERPSRSHLPPVGHPSRTTSHAPALQSHRDSASHSQSVPNLSVTARKPLAAVPIKEPAPKREVEQSHHHHHVISVDSETDFEKMHIDENKVNFLPYNPPVAVSQTGLIQSIGRPFNPNHAKYLPDPGDEFKLTRRVSQVKLDQIAILGDMNPNAITRLASVLKLFSLLIGAAGLVFFVFVISVASFSTPMEYPLYFLDCNPICKAMHIAGAVQPFAVAPYCRYALINLKHVRSYFLRVPLSLCIPLGVIVCGAIQFTNTIRQEGDLEIFLRERMAHYFRDTYVSTFSKSTWDGIQNSFDCCGFEAHDDWTRYSNSPFYPTSCCRKDTEKMNSCNSGSGDLKNSGCKPSYVSSNISITLAYCGLGLTIIILEVISVIFMRSLYGYIQSELYDERSNLSILGGKMCSLCDIEDTDEEIEYDEIVDHDLDETETTKDLKGQKREPPVKPGASATSIASKATTAFSHVPSANITKNRPLLQEIGHGRGRGRGRGINKVAPAP